MPRPTPRSRKPPPPTQPGAGVRRVWGESEKAHLKTLVASALVAGKIDWKEVAAALKTNRNAKTVQTKALVLGLRAPVERTRRGGNWDAQHRKQGDKNTSRPPAAALTSPVASPPEQPRPSRAAATAGAQQRQQTEQIVSGFDEQQLAATGLMSERSKREGWAHYYVSNLGAPPEEDWDGQGGTVSVIAQHFDVPKGSRGSVRSVLAEKRRNGQPFSRASWGLLVECTRIQGFLTTLNTFITLASRFEELHFGPF